MILNKNNFDTKIGTLYYLWLGEKKTPKVGALSTSKEWISSYILSTKENFDKVVIRDKKLPALEKEISNYLNGHADHISFKPVFLDGTEFEKRVWKEASEVPYGCTCSYGDLANMCGRPRAGRAVGNAMSKNPVMLIVPCHRIIKGDGSPGGFGSGPELKKELLALEGIIF